VPNTFLKFILIFAKMLEKHPIEAESSIIQPQLDVFLWVLRLWENVHLFSWDKELDPLSLDF
jgi:hypothetical protein